MCQVRVCALRPRLSTGVVHSLLSSSFKYFPRLASSRDFSGHEKKEKKRTPLSTTLAAAAGGGGGLARVAGPRVVSLCNVDHGAAGFIGWLGPARRGAAPGGATGIFSRATVSRSKRESPGDREKEKGGDIGRQRC